MPHEQKNLETLAMENEYFKAKYMLFD